MVIHVKLDMFQYLVIYFFIVLIHSVIRVCIELKVK